MVRATLTWALLLICQLAKSEESCPYTLTDSGKCVFFSSQQYEFAECETIVCGPANATLVCIEDATQNAEVYELSHGHYWIGYNDGMAGEGKWEWNRAGCTSTFTKWSDEEPNDYGGCEDCVVAGDEGDEQWGTKWNDMPCNAEAYCACEYGTSELSEEFSEWDPDDITCDYEDGLMWFLLWVLGQLIGLAAFVGFIFSIIGIVTACGLSEQGSKGCCGCVCCPPGTQYCVAIAFLIVDVIMLLLCLLMMILWDPGFGMAAAFYFVYACTATAAIVMLKQKQRFWNVPSVQPQAGVAMGTVAVQPSQAPAGGTVVMGTAVAQPAQGGVVMGTVAQPAMQAGVAMGTVLGGPIDAKSTA